MEKMEAKRRIVLLPAPAQGHLTPMMQLGTALNLKGFSVTVVQAQFNQVNSCSQNFFPSFHFVTLPETLPKSEIRRLGIFKFLLEFNKANEAGFKYCIAQLLQHQSNDIACIIYDEFMYFSEAAAKEFKLPSVMFTTQSATNQASRSVFNKLNIEKFLVDMEDPEMQEKMVENMHPLRYKDLMPRGFGTLNTYSELLGEVLNKRRTASAVILNTVRYLESSSLAWLQQELGVPTYSLGPLHITASAPSSLFEEDKSCIEWLSMQKPRSVMYISLGSIALSETKDVLEMAWGFINSNQPFLWVIRPGSIPGSEWIESFPEGISKMVAERGKIVKWVPQKDVLAHPAVGGFWSHCGWNSTLESIGEGVPLICRPSDSEQMLNALYIENVWRVGIQFEGELERGGVERAVKRLMGEEEGAGMRERAHALKEKVGASVRSGGSSYNALDELVKKLKTE